MDNRVVLGVDLGGTNVRFALVAPDFTVQNPHLIKVESLGSKDLVGNLLKEIKAYLALYKPNLAAIGIGVPGIVDSGGTILSLPNIEGLEGVHLGTRCTAEFQVPTFVEKDTNFLLYGEYQALKADGYSNMLGFYIGTGYGSAMIVNGQLLQGSRGFAGELGHIPVAGKTGLCGCGNRGCIEVYGAGRALTAHAEAHQQDVSEFFLLPENEKVRQEFVEYVSLGIITAINIFDPQCIVLGGGVLAMRGFPTEELHRLIRAGLRSDLQREDLVFIPSQAGVFGGCLGAAAYSYANINKTSVEGDLG